MAVIDLVLDKTGFTCRSSHPCQSQRKWGARPCTGSTRVYHLLSKDILRKMLRWDPVSRLSVEEATA